MEINYLFKNLSRSQRNADSCIVRLKFIGDQVQFATKIFAPLFLQNNLLLLVTYFDVNVLNKVVQYQRGKP